MNLLSLPDLLLLKVIEYLKLKDLLSLGDSNSKLREIVYKSPEIWTSNLLFPIGDKTITDRFTQRIIPRITRHYGILELKMIDLPLTWCGYLMIFDQFAHSVNSIEINTSIEELNKLAHHLSIFAGNLAMLQQNNKIPITFRQYAFDDEQEFSTALADSNYLDQRTLHNLNDHFATMKLDDPPFERLNRFRVVANNSHSNTFHLVRQLELLASFLSGRPINQQQQINNQHTPTSPIPTASITYNSNKRSRESNHSDYGSNNKHGRHDSNNSYYSHYHRQQQQESSSSSQQQQQQQQQQQETSPQQSHHRLPSYSSFA